VFWTEEMMRPRALAARVARLRARAKAAGITPRGDGAQKTA
jgi:hypothetical protein